MSSGKQTSYVHPAIFREIDGGVHFPGTTKAILRTFPELKTRSSDVIIASWPKSGATWTMEILWEMFNDAQIIDTRIDIKVPFLDVLCMSPSPTNQLTPDDVCMAFERLPSPRLMKTHLHYEFVPKGEDSEKPKIVLLIRNPKDCAVSYFHHYTGLGILNCDCDWNEFFELFMGGKLVGGSWFEYMREWWKHQHEPNILVLKYEDIKRDSMGMIKRIASYVQKDLSTTMLERIARQTTFQAMRDRPAFDHKWFGTKPGGFHFIRKGEVGDWKNYFTEEQNKRFEEVYDMKMKVTGLSMEFFNDF